MCRKGLKMPNIRKTPTKIIGFRVRDDMLEFFNSLENKNDFLVVLVAGCSAFISLMPLLALWLTPCAKCSLI